jgi:hypothetical protein
VNSTTRQNGRNESDEEVATYRRWGNLAERIVALAAVFALVVYVFQAIFMWNANTHAQTEQRAWLSISEPAWFDDPPKLGYAPRGTIKVTNLGLTPARIRRHFMRAWPMLEWHGFPRSLDMPLSVTEVQTIVPPKEERELSVFWLHTLTEEDVQHGIMVQFVVVYLDAFDNERVTVACYVYTLRATEKFKWSAFGLDDCDRME